MNKAIVVLLLSLVVWIACDITPEEAALKFVTSLEKHGKMRDEEIFDPDFYVADPDIRFSYRKSVEIIFEAINSPSKTNIVGFYTSTFTNEGLLKIRCYNKNEKYYSYFLAKPNKNIEGGYKFLRFVFE